jgi:hypothetical protein
VHRYVTEVMDCSTAAAQGDLRSLEKLLRAGADINTRSKDGMTPLSVAAFWGYTDVVKYLLENGADINLPNKGTNWTPLHCAAFQGHGPVILKLMAHKPDLALKDVKGRTAADFASALDAIWPHFQAAGCRRTPKSELIRLDIVQKVSASYERGDPVASGPANDQMRAHFSRPGSAYVMRAQNPFQYKDPNMQAASVTGDVLASLQEEPSYVQASKNNPRLLVMDN